MNNTALSFSSLKWASLEFQHCNFNDFRLTQRCIKIADTMLRSPHTSIPNAFATWSDVKGTYRFFDNKKVISKDMMDSHCKETIARCRNNDTLLIMQDTTTINLSNRQISGLGRIGMGSLQGFFVHSALATSTDGIPLGLLDQQVYVRKESTRDPIRHKDRKTIPIEEKETLRWKSAIAHVSETVKNKKLVFIGDRESDIYDVFHIAHQLKVNVLIRTAWNRRDSSTNKLFDQAQSGQILGSYVTLIPLKGTHETRSAKLIIRKCSFGLIPSKATKRKELPIQLTVINISEENAPVNVEPIHWILSTSLEVTTLEEAKEKVDWYIFRWRIERFHYILKTGAFNIENLQFERFTRWEKVITLFSIIAWKVLWILYESRKDSNAKAVGILSKEEVVILCKIYGKSQKKYTVGQAVIDIAKLGGFIGRRSDGSPGVKTLWRGFQKLPFVLLGYQFAQQEQRAEKQKFVRKKDMGKD